MKYDRITRWLHAGIALGVVVQLFCSLFMDVPAPGRSLPQAGYRLFLIHRWSGITVVSLVILHWLWNLSGHVAGGWGHLFPWFSGTRLRRLLSALKAMPDWLRGRLSGESRETIPLAGAVHGLGLVVATGMALTGSTIFFGMAPDGSMNGFIEVVREIHGFIANFIWAYFVGHVGMAVLHQLRGESLISNMFNLIAR